jgi:nitrogen fixation protein FixH
MKQGRQWLLILGALMALVIGANLVLVYMAVSDPSFAVEEDYYGKALAWDDKRDQDRRNAELGWSLEFELAPTRSPDGTLLLTAHLHDAAGGAIPDARLSLSTFHNARAGRIVRAELQGGEGGDYTAALPLFRPGLWEFRFEAVQGERRFTYTRLQEVAWR